jgi:hypothetical protein
MATGAEEIEKTLDGLYIPRDPSAGPRRTHAQGGYHWSNGGAAPLWTRRAKCVLVFMDKSDSTRPGPLVFIPHVVA